MEIKEINNRYSELSEDTCCLSCGGAVNYADVMEGEICVDLGSGRGTDALRLAQQVGPNGFVYGIDIASGMIEKAKKNADKLNVKNVKFINCELEKIELGDGIANVIISNCTINHAEDKSKVWSEIYRILKPGGRFIVSDIYSLEDVPEKYSKDAVAVSECWGGAITKDKYMEILRKSGLKEVLIHEESTPYDKGEIQVASFTISGEKPGKSCCCCH